jgi:hypothetical protein
LMDVAAVRAERAKGVSFDHRKVKNDFAASAFLSYLFGIRFRLPYFRARRVAWLERFRGALQNRNEIVKPAFIYYDTGADMHAALQGTAAPGKQFAALSLEYTGAWLNHLHGVTRKKMRWWDSNSTKETDVLAEVTATLRNQYGITP